MNLVYGELEDFRFVKAARRLLKPVTNELESIYRSDFSEELRFEALLALGKIADPESLNVLVAAFEAYNDYIEPITALGHFKSSTPVSKLMERIQDPDAPFKDEIARVLGEIGDPMASKVLMELLHDEDRMLRYFSARALYKMGGKEVVQSLCRLINDPDEWIVINVLEILSRMQDPEAIPALVGQYEIARDTRLKAIIISSLSSFSEPRLLKVFETALESYDPRIQANAVEAISKLKISPSEMRRKLKKLFKHHNNRVRANICIAMEEADPEMVLAEVEEMSVSKDVSTRRSAAYILAQTNLQNKEQYLKSLLSDENFQVRKMALKAATKFNEAFSVIEIQPMLKDENEWVRKQAIECACKINDFPEDKIPSMLKTETSTAVVKSILKFIVTKNLTHSATLISERVKQESQDELPHLISTLGHIKAKEELVKVKKFLEAVRTEIMNEYYLALLLNGDLSVFEEIIEKMNNCKRENEYMVWIKVAGAVGGFIKNTQRYSKPLFQALAVEVQKDIKDLDLPQLSKPLPEISHGIELFENREYSNAKHFFEKNMTHFAQEPDAMYYFAASCYNLGETSTAMKMLEDICSKQPSHIPAGILLGQIYFRRKYWQKLAACYELLSDYIADDDKKNTLRVYGALGLAYYHQTRYHDAVRALRKGLGANPRDLSSSYHLALCFYALGETEKTRAILERLKTTLPGESKILKSVMELLQRI